MAALYGMGHARRRPGRGAAYASDAVVFPDCRLDDEQGYFRKTLLTHALAASCHGRHGVLWGLPFTAVKPVVFPWLCSHAGFSTRSIFLKRSIIDLFARLSYGF